MVAQQENRNVLNFNLADLIDKQNDNGFSQAVLKFLSRSHVSTFRQIPINGRSEEEE